MGIGEYVSVSTQADTEAADRAMEEAELAADPQAETAELRSIYESRGLPRALAQQVADTLMATDPVGAHLRDELGLTEELAARPLQAALASTGSFAAGAAVPLVVAASTGDTVRSIAVTLATLVAMVALGAIGAALGGADRVRGALRVGVGGGAALALTFLIGRLFGTAVG
jgi:VIT1/CCC1 family predicted Fe2+/Mn2+ transporter